MSAWTAFSGLLGSIFTGFCVAVGTENTWLGCAATTFVSLVAAPLWSIATKEVPRG